MRYILSILLTCAFAVANAQVNLVLNPSFESYNTCPFAQGQVRYSNNWSGLDSSWYWGLPIDGNPYYCNMCSSNPTSSVPYNAAFYHYCRTGAGMMGVAMYHDDYMPDTGESRNYLQGQLANTLTTGHAYIVTFYTVLESPVYAINHIGAYLDDGTIDSTHQPGIPQTQYTPQILDTALIGDTLNWTKIQGIFTATGAERFITIGNFSDCAHTHAVPLIDTTGFWAWGGGGPGGTGFSDYLIDDVSVIDCSTQPFAGDDTTIHVGDSVYLGSTEILIPWEWYVRGDTTPIATGAGVWVTPTVTTTYVVKNNICGLAQGAIWDTVVVTVDTGSTDTTHHVNNVSITPLLHVLIFPNPTSEILNVVNASHCGIQIFDAVGVEVFHSIINADKESIDIENLVNGVYFVHVTDEVTGLHVVREVLKE